MRIFVSLNTSVSIEGISVSFVESVIDVNFPGGALESPVESVIFVERAGEGEPKFDLICVFIDFGVFDGEGLFQLYS